MGAHSKRQVAPHTMNANEVVTVERMVPGGEGLARLGDGRVVFVPGAFSGDRVHLKTLQLHGSYARADDWELTREAPGRRTAPCDVANECGGCDWMNIDESTQHQLALQLVTDAFRRVGKFDPPPSVTSVYPSRALGYRSRVRLQLTANGALGFLARSSNRIVPIGRCPVCAPEVNDALARLASSLGAPDRARAIAEAIEQLELRVLGKTPEVLLFECQDAVRSAVVETWCQELREHFIVAWVNEGSSFQPQTVRLSAGVTEVDVQLRPGVFTQVNWETNQALVDELVSGALSRGIRSFADLYCGNGNFSLPLLASGLRGDGVEVNPTAITCARDAARARGLQGCFEVGPVEHTARRWAHENRHFDLVILDPPRAGALQALRAVAQLARSWIFYCACDPVSLARDARRLCELGFELEQLKIFDMFPQTHHVESVAWLKRKERA